MATEQTESEKPKVCPLCRGTGSVVEIIDVSALARIPGGGVIYKSCPNWCKAIIINGVAS